MTKFSSIFGQMLQILPHKDFIRAVREARAEKVVKGFGCWGRHVMTLSRLLGKAHLLREICGALAICL